MAAGKTADSWKDSSYMEMYTNQIYSRRKMTPFGCRGGQIVVPGNDQWRIPGLNSDFTESYETKPVSVFSPDTFGCTTANMDIEFNDLMTGEWTYGYSYRSIEDHLFRDAVSPYLLAFNNFRSSNLMSPVKCWYDNYSVVQLMFDRNIPGLLKSDIPWRFLDLRPKDDDMINLEMVFQCHEDLVGDYLKICSNFGLTEKEILEYCFLVGLDVFDIEHYISRIVMEEFDAEDLKMLKRCLVEKRALPLVLFDKSWCFQQPHISLMNFIDIYESISFKTKLRLLTMCERQSTKWFRPHERVMCLSSDGTLLEERPSRVAEAPVYRLESQFETFCDKYKGVFEEAHDLDLQGIFALSHKIKTEDVQEVVNIISSQFKDILSNIKDMAIQAFSILLKIVATIVIFYVVRKTVLNPNFSNIFDLILCVLFGGAILTEMAPIFGVLEEYNFKETINGYLRLEASDSEDGISSRFCLLTLSQLFKVDCLSRKNCKDFVWFVSQAPRFSCGLEYVCKYVKDMYDHCVLYFKKYVLKMDILTPESPVCKWIESVENIVKKYSGGTLVLDEVLQTKLFDLWKEGNDFMLNPVFRSDYTIISKYTNLIFQLMEKIPFSKRNGKFGSLRPPPATILLLGKSNVGKSTVTFPLSCEIATRIMLNEHADVLSNEDIFNSIYARNSEQEYWDGYTGQLITVYDDFMQRVDSSSNPNLEIFEIIRASNIFPYPLHMAELKDKSCTWFNSPVLIASSNMTPNGLQRAIHSLNYPPALIRRFEMVVNVELVGERPAPGSQFDKSRYKFTRTVFTLDKDDKVIQENVPITYDEIVKFCVQRYHDNKATCKSVHDNMLENIEKIRSELVSGESKDEIQIRPKVIEELQEVDLEPQGPIQWFKDLFSDEDDIFSDAEWDAAFAYNPDDFFDLTPETSNPIVVPLDIEQDKKTVSHSWLDKYRNICAEYPIIKYLSYIGMAIAAITVGFSIYSFLKGDGKKVFKGGKQFVIPTVESQEKEGSLKVVSIESNEKDSSVKAVKIESQEKLSTVSKVSVESEDKKQNLENNSTTETKTDVGQLEVNQEIKLLSLQQCASAVSEHLSSEGCSDQNAAEIISSVVCRNLYAIFIVRSDNSETRLGHILFLKERIGLIPQHFLYFLGKKELWEENAYIEFRSVFLRNNMFRFYLKDFMSKNKFYSPPPIDNKLVDICLVEILGVNNHPNILSHFVSKTDISAISRSDVVLPFIHVPPSSRYSPYAVMCYGSGVSELVKHGGISSAPLEGKTYYARQSWKYKLQSQPGACGAPAILVGIKQGPGRICGMHVMGDNDGYGFSASITKEDLDCWIKDLNPTLTMSEAKELALNAGVKCVLPFPGKFVPLGKAKHSITSASKTQIEKSLLYGKISEVKKKPAWLCPGVYQGEPWDPRIYRLERFGSDRSLIRLDILDKIVLRYVHKVKCLEISETKRSDNFKSKYDFETACKGIDGDPTFNSIKRKTSAGYPWCTKYKDGKSQIFGKDGDFDFTTPGAQEIKQRVCEVESLAERGICDLHVFVDTLKDERKPIAKAHKTRLFSACPLEYLILCRMYFQGAVSRLVRTRISNGVAVGMNVYSCEWSQLALHLLKNKHFVAGDFEGFDSSEERETLRRAANILIELSEDESLPQEERSKHRKVRIVLLDALLESVHYSLGYLYAWSKGLPSGHFLTAIVNSLFVILNLCYAFVSVAPFSVDEAISVFFNEFSFIAYGDDHVLGVPDRFVDLINQRTLPGLFARVGLTYTMEDKDRVVDVDTRSIYDVSFIKRTFKLIDNPQRWIAPLDLDSILDCMNWRKKGEDSAFNTEANVSFALKELSMHDENVWDLWFPKILSACEEVGVNVAYLNRESAFEAVLAVEDRIYDD